MRQFVASCLPNKKGCISLTEKERRYLINVLRIKNGEEIEVLLPNGVLCAMQIRFSKQDAKKNTKVELFTPNEISSNVEEPCSGNEYWLFQIVPKGQKMDLIVRQATECGVSAIIPIIGDFSIVGKNRDGFSENSSKIDRWTRIVREAQQQSGSHIKTKIFSPCSIESAIDIWRENNNQAQKKNVGFVLCEKKENQENLFSIIKKETDISNARIGFVIGCEGGISPSEISLLRENNFYEMHLNTNILRAETATLYSLAVLQTVVGEYSVWKELNE